MTSQEYALALSEIRRTLVNDRLKPGALARYENALARLEAAKAGKPIPEPVRAAGRAPGMRGGGFTGYGQYRVYKLASAILRELFHLLSGHH